MALPKSYLTSIKNLTNIFNAILSAQAPERFSITFLNSLEFKSSSDRLFIGVLRSLGFIDADNRPTQRYLEYLDQTQSKFVLAAGIREAYADLFQINKNAHTLTRAEVINKFKTLGQGKLSDSVLDKMGMTFVELCKLADFSTSQQVSKPQEQKSPEKNEKIDEKEQEEVARREGNRLRFEGLVYNIQIVLPETRDASVYDALFRAMKEHLGQ